MAIRRLFCLVLLAAIVQPGFAGVLVLKDGDRVETRGPWQVRGRIVVFTKPNGVLSSIGSDWVDFEQSHRASVPVEVVPQPPTEPEVRRRIMVLTNATLRSAATGTRRPAEPQEDDRPVGARRSSGLVVDSWAEIEDESRTSVEILGTLSNRGGATESVAGLVVVLSAGKGRGDQRVEVVPEEAVLAPGSSTTFRARFYGVGRDHGRPRFEIESSAGGNGDRVHSAAGIGN